MDWPGAGAIAAEGEVGDVDAVLAEDGADAADDAGHIEVAADQEGAVERGFDIDAVELEQAGLLAVNHGGRRWLVPSAVCNLMASAVAGAAAIVLLLVFVNANAALFGYRGGVDAVDVFGALKMPAMAALRTRSVLASVSVPP